MDSLNLKLSNLTRGHDRNSASLKKTNDAGTLTTRDIYDRIRLKGSHALSYQS